MAKTKLMVRILLFFPGPVLEQIRGLGVRYGVTVSEGVRTAATQGLPDVPAQLRRNRVTRMRTGVPALTRLSSRVRPRMARLEAFR